MAIQITPQTPGLPSTSAISDVATRQFANAVASTLAAQQQQMAAGAQTYVTKDGLASQAAVLFRSGLQMSKSAFDAAILSSPTWGALSKRIEWIDNANNQTLRKLSELGDGFTNVRVEQSGMLSEVRAIKVSSENVSAGLIEERTARIDSQSAFVTAINAMIGTVGGNTALIVEDGNVAVNTGTAAADRLTQMQAEVFGADGTSIRAALTEEANARVSLEDGISATYTVRLDGGGRWAGFGLGLSGAPGAVQSEFIIAADKFAIVKPGDPGDTPRIPFGVDGDGNTYIQGTLLVNPGGTPLEDALSGSDGLSIAEVSIYLRASSAPSTPSGGTYNFSSKTVSPPSGWSMAVPSGSLPCYVSKASVASSDPSAVSIAISGWSSPVVAFQNGADGATGPAGATGATGSSGPRGTVQLIASGSSWSDSTANSAITSATGSSTRIIGDIVTITNNSSFSQTRAWNGSSWITASAWINGNMIVSGTLVADQVAAGTMTGSTVRTSSSGTRVQLESGTNELQVYISGTKRAWLGGNSDALLYMEPGTQTGVYVYTSASSTAYGAALHGSNIGNTTSSYGVRGDALGMYGIGVLGRNTNPFGVTLGYGVYGEAAGSGTGVYGKSTTGPAVHCDGVFRWGGYSYAAPNGSTSEFLRRDGTWAAPSGGGGGGVTSFNGRTGAVSLTAADVTSALGSTYVQNSNYASSAGSASSSTSASYVSNSAGAYMQTGSYKLELQTDRNLVLYSGGTAVWNSGTSVSDERLKAHIQDTSTSGLDVICALRVADYQWKPGTALADGGKTHTGLIAQEVAGVIPSAVRSASGTLLLHKEEIIPYLIKAIQELQAEVVSLRGQIES